MPPVGDDTQTVEYSVGELVAELNADTVVDVLATVVSVVEGDAETDADTLSPRVGDVVGDAEREGDTDALAHATAPMKRAGQPPAALAGSASENSTAPLASKPIRSALLMRLDQIFGLAAPAAKGKVDDADGESVRGKISMEKISDASSGVARVTFHHGSVSVPPSAWNVQRLPSMAAAAMSEHAPQ